MVALQTRLGVLLLGRQLPSSQPKQIDQMLKASSRLKQLSASFDILISPTADSGVEQDEEVLRILTRENSRVIDASVSSDYQVRIGGFVNASSKC